MVDQCNRFRLSKCTCLFLLIVSLIQDHSKFPNIANSSGGIYSTFIFENFTLLHFISNFSEHFLFPLLLITLLLNILCVVLGGCAFFFTKVSATNIRAYMMPKDFVWAPLVSFLPATLIFTALLNMNTGLLRCHNATINNIVVVSSN